jgi:hypothetical protein
MSGQQSAPWNAQRGVSFMPKSMSKQQLRSAIEQVTQPRDEDDPVAAEIRQSYREHRTPQSRRRNRS